MIMAFQGQVRPYITPLNNKIDLINETLTLVCTYGLIIFTDFVPNPEARYQCGWVLIGITCGILTLNIAVLGH